MTLCLSTILSPYKGQVPGHEHLSIA